jgi:hypothetical protein
LTELVAEIRAGTAGEDSVPAPELVGQPGQLAVYGGSWVTFDAAAPAVARSRRNPRTGVCGSAVPSGVHPTADLLADLEQQAYLIGKLSSMAARRASSGPQSGTPRLALQLSYGTSPKRAITLRIGIITDLR